MIKKTIIFLIFIFLPFQLYADFNIEVPIKYLKIDEKWDSYDKRHYRLVFEKYFNQLKEKNKISDYVLQSNKNSVYFIGIKDNETYIQIVEKIIDIINELRKENHDYGEVSRSLYLKELEFRLKD